MKNFSWKNKRENLIIELTKNLEDYKKSILESLSSLVPDDVGDVQFYLKSDNLDNLNEDINEKAANLAKYMKDFEKASTIEYIKEEWFKFRTNLIKNLGNLKISLNKKLSNMDFSYIDETYIQQLGSFEEKLDSMESEQVEKHLETYQNFTKEVGSIISNFKKLRSQIILNYNAINKELKHPDLINWKDLETAIDTAKDQFQAIRSEFISSQGLIYKLLILKNMLTETEQVTTFYDKVITSDDILQLEQTLKLLYRVINRLEDKNKAFNQAVINFVLGKLHLNEMRKMKQSYFS